MNFTSCSQTCEVAAAVRDGHWPMACDPGLRAHVSDCPSCSELVLIAEALRRDRAEAIRSAPLASPSLLWWRAQLLRRQQAMRQVARPIDLAAELSLGAMVVFIIGLVVWRPSELGAWLLISTQSLNPFAADAVGSQAEGVFPLPLLIVGLAVLALFAAFALYLICQRE